MVRDSKRSRLSEVRVLLLTPICERTLVNRMPSLNACLRHSYPVVCNETGYYDMPELK